MNDDKSLKKHLKNFKPSEIFQKEYGFTVEDSTFCIMPFIHLSTTTNGEYRLCCRSSKLWNVNNISIKELWNHSKYKSVRKNLMIGVKDTHCSACWKMEEKGIISLRQTQNFERLRQYVDVVKDFKWSSLIPFKIPIVEFKLSNLCNLKCKMCWPKDSTPWIQDWDKIKHIHNDDEREYIDKIINENNLNKKPILNLYESNETFVNDLFEIIDEIKEFEFAGGEPLMDPLHFKMLDKIKNPKDVILKYSTNLTNLEAKKGRNIVDLWKKFKSVRLTISIDGYDELNSYIRKGSNWNDIKENIVYVKKELGDKLDYIRASTCISALNVEYLVETLDSITIDFDIPWHTSRLQWPIFLHANVLSIDRLEVAKLKIEKRLEETDKEIFSVIEMNTRRHLLDSIAWINECIKNNKHIDYYNKFVEFNNILDEKQNVL